MADQDTQQQMPASQASTLDMQDTEAPEQIQEPSEEAPPSPTSQEWPVASTSPVANLQAMTHQLQVIHRVLLNQGHAQEMILQNIYVILQAIKMSLQERHYPDQDTSGDITGSPAKRSKK